MNYLNEIEKELSILKNIPEDRGLNSFFAQELLRFYTIAKTLSKSDLIDDQSVDARYITHILARSIFENFFWIVYIFDDPDNKVDRYNELINAFKSDYSKLYQEPKLQNYLDKLEPAEQSWSTLSKGLDVRSMLAQIKDGTGKRFDNLYYIYRILSFDTHGRNLNAIFHSVFGKECGFLKLDLNYAFENMAHIYIVILKQLIKSNELLYK